MAGYKSLQVAEALSRVSQQLKPQVTVGTLENSAYGRNTNTPSPLGNLNKQIQESQQYYNSIDAASKSGGEYIQDGLVSLGKGIVSVPQAAAGLVDLADAAASAIGTGLTGGNPADIQTGRFTKLLDDSGVKFKETQDIMNGWFSDATQRQMRELSALPGMSTEKSLGENLSSLGQTAGYVLDNPSMAVNTIIQSLPLMGAGGAIGRGAVAATAGRAAPVAGAVGEGSVMAGAAQSNMDTDAEGYTTAAQSLGALGIGVLGGAVGQAGNRFAGHRGANDIDSLAAGVPATTTNQGFKSLGVGTITEAAEEAAQSSLENVIANVASGKDAIEGLNQDLVLGTFAGAGMGAAANAKSSLQSAALDAVMTAAQKQADKIKERIEQQAPEKSDTATSEFADPKSEKYNPSAAIVREAKALPKDATPEQITQVKTNVDQVLNDAETHLAGLQEVKKTIESEPVVLQNIASAEAAIEQFAEVAPERAAKAQQVLENVLKPQLAQIEELKANTDLEKTNSAIEYAQSLVNDARDMHGKYAAMFQSAEDVMTAEPVAKIYGAPTSFSVEEIESVIQSPNTTPEQKQSLRVLADAIAAQNAVKTIDEVNGQIVGKKFDANYRSTPQYLEQFSTAVRNKSVPAQQNLMREIQAFESSHVQKASLVDTGLAQVKQTGQPVQIIRNQSGTWEFNQGTFLKGEAATKNGAVTIHATPRGIAAMEKTNEYMQAEAKAITATRTAMQAMTATQQPQQQAQSQQAPVMDATQPMDFTAEVDPFDAAMDSYNQEARANYEWQPNSRSEDPRSTGILETAVNTPAGETSIPETVQPTSGTTPTASGTVDTEQPTAQDNLTTWDNIQPNQEVTLYRGESENNVEGGEWWTTDKAKAERFGKVQEFTVNSADIGKYAHRGHGGADEFVFADLGKRPPQLAQADRVSEQSASVATDTEDQTSVQAQEEVQQEAEYDAAEALDEITKKVRAQERKKEPKKRNLVNDGFNLKNTVLNLHENFMSRYMNRNDNTQVVTTLTGTEPTAKQKQVLKDFTGFAEKMRKHLTNIVGNKQEDYRYQDFNQFLLVDGSLPENITTAVSAAMFTWLAENGSKTLDNEKEVLSKMLLEDAEAVPDHVYAKLQAIGTHQNTVAASIGQKAFNALGLKVTKDVDPNRQAKLEMGLGTMAVVALVQQGYLTRNVLSNAEMNQLISDTMAINEDATEADKSHLLDAHQFAFLTTADQNDLNEPNKKVAMIVESGKQTQGIVNQLFDVPTDNKLPSLEPVKTTPNSFNRMGSQLPEFAKEVYEVSQGNGYKMSAPAMQFIDKVSRDDLKEMFGYVQPNPDGESFPGMHKKFWKGQLAANQALERSLDIIEEQRLKLGKDDTEFFFEHTIWTNQRSGYDSVFNLQANKVHRAVAGMSAHVTEVGVGEPTHDASGLTTKYGEFLMAVAMTAEEIPIGLPTVDKITSKTYLAAFQEYLKRDYVQAGIQSMAAILEGNKPAKEDLANVKALVQEFGMGPMSVRGIQALAQHYIAERDGAKTFTSDIAFESDGVTNGPVITNVALATAVADMLTAGGIFTDKSMTSVPQYKEMGGQDIYEQLGEVMKAKWLEYKNSPDTKPRAKASAEALGVIYPVFGERKGAKPITTTSNYGAGNASIIRANGREVLNAFYKGLEKAGKKGDMDTAQGYINALNTVLEYHNSFLPKVPLAKADGNPLEFMLTPAQEQALMNISGIQHGKAIKATLESAMGNFQVARDIITENAVASFAAYEIIRKDALDKAASDTTDIIVDGKGQRQEGISTQQKEKALRAIAKYTPSVVSGMGNNSSNGKQSSIPLMKQSTTWDSSMVGQQQFNFVGKFEKGGAGQGKFSVKTGVKTNSVSDPGVSGLALIIQSIDAFIAHSVLKAMPTQNFHDANGGKVGDGKKMAKVQNEAFVDGLMTTHVNREFTRALAKPFQAFLDNPTLLSENKKAAQEAYEQLSQSITERVNFAYSQDLAKLNGMKDWVHVNQYGTEGGHFTMTNAKRKQIVDAVDQLKKDWKKDLAQAEKIDALFNTKANAKTSSIESMLNQGTVKAEDLVPVIQAEIKQFQNREGNVGKFSQFYDSVLDLVTQRMPKDLEINYFTQGNAPENVYGEQLAIDKNNPAWFTQGKNGKPQINIFKTNEAVTAKVLVHELVHAITVEAIAEVQANPDDNPKAKESLDKLNELFEHIKAKVNQDTDASDVIKYGVDSLEEFIATGFSYPEFVDYLDATLAPPAKRGKNRIITALRSFVENILGVLESFTGRKYLDKDATALEALILDSTEFLGRVNPMTKGMQISIFGAPQQARDKVSGYTSRQVFDALNSNLNPQFKLHLSSMMTNVSDQIFGSLDQRLIDNPDGTWSPEKAWEEYINAGNAETTETAVTAGFRMTEQETFAVESLYAALKAGIKGKTMTQVYAEMDKAFKSARDKLKPQDFYEGDWNTASRDDKQDAQDRYDFLFKLGSQNPEHLSRFVAMAIGSEYVNGKLGFTVRDSNEQPSNTFEKLVEGTNSVIDYVSGLMTNSSSSQLVNNKLGLLSKELARIDAKHRSNAVNKVEQQLEKITDLADGVTDKIRDKVVELAEKDAVAKSRFTAVRLASNVTRLSAKGDLWTTLDVLKEASAYENPNSKLGILGEIVNEAANNDSTKDSFEHLLRMTKLNNQMKENLREATTNNVMSTFDENGSYLTKEDKHALTNMLRVDVQSLTDHYSMADIAKMFTNGTYLNTELKSLEKQVLVADPQGQIMINRAKQLAKYMVTGKSSPGLAKNAQLIVSGFNTGEVVDISDNRVTLIDQIASMYAIEYMNVKDKARLNTIFKRELKNKTNGIDTSIKFHKELSKVAREKLFADNAVSMAKGFMPEITNHNREVRIANSAAEAQLLKNQFYKQVKPLTKDKYDPSAHSPVLFLTEEANIQRLVSGAIEVVSTNRKGTSVTMDAKARTNVTNQIAKSFPTSPNYNPMHDKDVAMVPNYDTTGNVIAYSYEMSAENRDNYLERNNDFSELLGAYAATNFNKVKVPEQNAKVVDALYDDYKQNFKDNPRKYVNIGPNAKDPGLREMWAMLPEATRKHINDVWAVEKVYGQGGMMVRSDLMLMLFGYRKYSLNQSFDKMKEARNTFEKLYVGIMQIMFGDNAKVRGVQGERAWQEAVSLLKDIVVIRNLKTMLFNTMSNAMLLMAHGINPTDVVKDSLTAVRAGTKYRRDMANLIAIRQKQRAGVGDFNKLEQEALKLEDSINRNELKDFIEAGMMPTIVEDVDPSTDHYSYKSKMQQRVEQYTNKVPKSVRTAAKWAFVSPDTPVYKFLNNATQFSDFSAKYAMYKYYTEKAKDKLEHKAALQIASDNFINYDVPTARGLQYLNDMGVVMFTKYNMRIQKALFQLLKKRPATAMAQALFINSFTNLEAGIDPLIWFNLGNPLREGAFGLPSALDEPFPIKILSGM